MSTTGEVVVLRTFLIGFAAIVLVTSCADKPQLLTRSKTQFFVQNFNPPYIDVLWVVDDRSQMKRASVHLTAEATGFFRRLDSSASQYRMAFTTADMDYNRGALKSSAPITKTLGDIESRAAVFSAIFHSLINLRTSGLSKGVGASVEALTNFFQPRAGIPLVIVYISDSYDASEAPDSDEKIKYFSNQLSVKVGRKDLIKVYSINYTADGERCATLYNADIDNDHDKKGSLYESLSKELSGDTGDLCGGFSKDIDLTALRLKELANRFKLDGVPNRLPEVHLTLGGKAVENPKWTYDSATNEIVFIAPPLEGTTIQIVY